MMSIIKKVSNRMIQIGKIAWLKITEKEELDYNQGTNLEIIRTFVLLALVIANVDVMAVQSLSMSPHLQYGDIHFAIRRVYSIDRGDVVQFKSPDDPQQVKSNGYGKRVIGLPNEKISMNLGEVYIDGVLLNEDYVVFERGDDSFDEITLGNNQYFVMGDNRNNSLDSRSFGAIEKDTIFSKSVIKILHFDKVVTLLGKISGYLEAQFGEYSAYNLLRKNSILFKESLTGIVVKYFGE